MKRVMVILIVLLLTGLIASSAGALDLSSTLSSLGLSGTGTSSSGSPYSSLGSASSLSTPSSDLSVSTPDQSAFSSWDLNNMKFFSPDNHASTSSLTSIPASDYNGIMQTMSQLPTSDQMSNYTSSATATATPTATNNSTDTFTSEVASTIPLDDVIFIEVSKNTMLIDPSNAGVAVPNVTMNYKFSDSSNTLVLKKKAGVDYNASQLYFGYADSDDVNDKYVYDYSIGSSLGVSVTVLFTGSDGRIRIRVNGETKDLKKGEKYEKITDSGGERTVLDVTNWGLVPKANIQVSDTI